jgi:hypothetical protein
MKDELGDVHKRISNFDRTDGLPTSLIMHTPPLSVLSCGKFRSWIDDGRMAAEAKLPRAGTRAQKVRKR